MTERPAAQRNDVPRWDELYHPVIVALRDLGGSATMPDLEAHIIENMRLRDDILDEILPSGSMPRLRNRISWARNYLKHCGYVENPSRGVWSLTRTGLEALEVDRSEITRRARDIVQRDNQPAQMSEGEPETEQDQLPDDEEHSWRDQLLRTLLAMSSSDFERLAQQILIASGFKQVVVTGKSGDGGIDGHGMLSVEGLVSFPISFQCKRYKGSVSSNAVREFRGSLGRQAERGLLITTGTFTPDARRESIREGAVFIDLMDGDALMDKLRELKLGVKVEMVEQTTVDFGWWESNYDVAL